jgi:ABC-type thiamine transport system substrate-binding protein
MKKLLTALVITLFIISIPFAAQAASYKALEAKASAALGSRTALQVYHYGVVIAYYTAVSGEWWTGLAVYNAADSTNSLMVGCYDTTGAAVAVGTLTLEGNALSADLISGFMDSGTVPTRGSIAVFGTEDFMVDRYLGNTIGGGFGEVQLEAEYY